MNDKSLNDNEVDLVKPAMIPLLICALDCTLTSAHKP